MSLKLTDTVASFLKKNDDKRFTARQIAEWIFEAYPKECREKKEKSKSLKSDADLIQQIVSEIGAKLRSLQNKYPQIKTTADRPRTYFWQNSAETTFPAPSGEVGKERILKNGEASEDSLYPLLCQYLWADVGLYPMRIDEKRASNRKGQKGNKWLYPDIVAMEHLSREWHAETKAIVAEYSDRRTKLWSFEVKRNLSLSNVREAFFQTVSNSTWANFGYLVAAEIDSETERELRILSGLHGIGVILLNKYNPTDSEIKIPARERLDIDWAACDRILAENSDFREFIKKVREFHQTGNAREKDWDISVEKDEL